MVRQAGDTGIKMNISHVHVMNMARDGAEAVKAAKETMDYFDGLVASGIDLSYDVIPRRVLFRLYPDILRLLSAPLSADGGDEKKTGGIVPAESFPPASPPDCKGRKDADSG